MGKKHRKLRKYNYSEVQKYILKHKGLKKLVGLKDFF